MSQKRLSPYVVLNRISEPPNKLAKWSSSSTSPRRGAAISTCTLIEPLNSDSSESDCMTPRLRRSTRRRRRSSAMLMMNSAASDGEDVSLSPLSSLSLDRSPSASPASPPARWHANFRKVLCEIAWEETNRIRFETKGFYGKKLQVHTPLVARNLSTSSEQQSAEDMPNVGPEPQPKEKKVAKTKSQKAVASKISKQSVKRKSDRVHEWKVRIPDKNPREAGDMTKSPERKKKFFSSASKSPSRRPSSKVMIGNHRVYVMPAKVNEARVEPKRSSLSMPDSKKAAIDETEKRPTDTTSPSGWTAENGGNVEVADEREVSNAENIEVKERGIGNNAGATPKLFSLFGKQSKDIARKPKMATKSPIARRLRPCPRISRTKDGDNMQQLVIDVGQKEVAAVQCKECRMLYTPCDEEDSQTHDYYHNALFVKLRFPGWKKENVVQHYRDGRVVCIKPTDPKYAVHKAMEVKHVVDTELGYAVEEQPLPNSAGQTVYLFVSDDKMVVGCLVAESVSKAYRIVPGAATNCCETTPVDVLCGVNRLWTLASHRRRKIASHLVECLKSSFVYGHVMSCDEVAFSSPSPNGHAFASNYVGPRYLVYK